ncbi:MAG TPA: hypothetical protein ENN30_00125 [Candidatus Woesearchaeota archaeon]|nr:hypothetical protein [Candidatus Woesearchaeota archaeon]
MDVWLKNIFTWTPRILSIIFIAFISVFALDVFGAYVFPELLLALFIHLIPIFALIATTIIAWKWENIGGFLFFGLALAFTFYFETYNQLLPFFVISFPVFLISGLFLLNYYVVQRN